MKTFLILSLTLLTSLTTALGGGFETNFPAIHNGSPFTYEQQLKDKQQQAKEIRQQAKDDEQAARESRLTAASRMLDRREFTYNSQKPDPNYKCPKPCCNEEEKKEEPVAQYWTPTDNKRAYAGLKNKKDSKVILFDDIPYEEHQKIEAEVKKKFPNEPFRASMELTRLKDEYKAKYPNRTIQ